MIPLARVKSTAVLLGVVVATGCGGDAAEVGPFAMGAGEMEPIAVTPAIAVEALDVTGSRSPRDVAMPEIQIAATSWPDDVAQEGPVRRIIRSGSIRLEVDDLAAATASVQTLADAFGGYVAGSELREGREGARTATMTLRMPSDSVDALMAGLPDLGRVLARDVRAQEVTREYVDLETRLAVKEETVERLRALAARGGSLEDLLAAEREVGRAVSELEVLKGQMRSLSRRIAEADIRVTLFEPGAAVGSGAFRPLVEAFRDSGEVLARSLATLVYGAVFALPWLVVGVVLLWLTRRWLRGRKGAAGAEG
jgi:hypothetical protein